MLPAPGNTLDALDDGDHCDDPGSVGVLRARRGNGELTCGLSPGSIQNSVPVPIQGMRVVPMNSM